jgi:hypothetical protein
MGRYSRWIRIYGFFVVIIVVVARTPQCAPVDVYDAFGAEQELILLNAGADLSLISKREVSLGYLIVDRYLKRGV